MKKEERYEKIREIIGRQVIETQEDLTNALREEGIEVTQATVSRDIKELMLTKVPMGQGRYRYAAPATRAEGGGFFQASRIARLFRDTVLRDVSSRPASRASILPLCVPSLSSS